MVNIAKAQDHQNLFSFFEKKGGTYIDVEKYKTVTDIAMFRYIFNTLFDQKYQDPSDVLSIEELGILTKFLEPQTSMHENINKDIEKIEILKINKPQHSDIFNLAIEIQKKRILLKDDIIKEKVKQIDNDSLD